MADDNTKNWIKKLRYNPIDPMLRSDNVAISYFTKRDLLSEDVPPMEYIWRQEAPRKILKKQDTLGYWRSKSRYREKAPAVNMICLKPSNNSQN